MTAEVAMGRPSNLALSSGLRSLLGQVVTVLERRSNPRASTCPSEIVTCKFSSGRTVHLLCKYQTTKGEHTAFGHRAGLGYEARVYREVVEPSGLSAPRFFGEFTGPFEGLAIEFVEAALCACDADPVETSLQAAARWAGAFHALNEGATRAINRYDVAYYQSWPQRTADMVKRWHDEFPWLASVCRRAIAGMEALTEQPTTVIHGEFTPQNVLIKAGKVYPVDWESAAMGLGEIDLASLTDKWPPHVAEGCEREYQAARWPHGTPKAFEYRLNLARLYWDFRWLGERAEWTESERSRPRLGHLRQIAERLGWV